MNVHRERPVFLLSAVACKSSIKHDNTIGIIHKTYNQIVHFTNMFLTEYTADQYISHFSLKLTMIVYEFFVELHDLSLFLAERTVRRLFFYWSDNQ